VSIVEGCVSASVHNAPYPDLSIKHVCYPETPSNSLASRHIWFSGRPRRLIFIAVEFTSGAF